MCFVLIIVCEMYSGCLEISEKRRKVNTWLFRKWPHYHTMCLFCNGSNIRRGIIIQDKLPKIQSIKSTTEVPLLSDISGEDVTPCYLSQQVFYRNTYSLWWELIPCWAVGFVMEQYRSLNISSVWEHVPLIKPLMSDAVWCDLGNFPVHNQKECSFPGKKNTTKINTVLAGSAALTLAECCLCALMMAQHSACRVLPGKDSSPLFLSTEIDPKA